MSETIFADGIKFFDPRENAPDFVLGTISISMREFFAWGKAHTELLDDEKRLKLQVLRSKKGMPYVKVDTFKPEPKPEPLPPTQPDDDIPF